MSYFTRYLQRLVKFWQRRKKWEVDSASKLREQSGFTVSWKYCLNLCSLRSLKGAGCKKFSQICLRLPRNRVLICVHQKYWNLKRKLIVKLTPCYFTYQVGNYLFKVNNKDDEITYLDIVPVSLLISLNSYLPTRNFVFKSMFLLNLNYHWRYSNPDRFGNLAISSSLHENNMLRISH